MLGLIGSSEFATKIKLNDVKRYDFQSILL